MSDQKALIWRDCSSSLRARKLFLRNIPQNLFRVVISRRSSGAFPLPYLPHDLKMSNYYYSFHLYSKTKFQRRNSCCTRLSRDLDHHRNRKSAVRSSSNQSCTFLHLILEHFPITPLSPSPHPASPTLMFIRNIMPQAKYFSPQTRYKKPVHPFVSFFLNPQLKSQPKILRKDQNAFIHHLHHRRSASRLSR